MIAIATPPTINEYSIAVAPDSSVKNFLSKITVLPLMNAVFPHMLLRTTADLHSGKWIGCILRNRLHYTSAAKQNAFASQRSSHHASSRRGGIGVGMMPCSCGKWFGR